MYIETVRKFAEIAEGKVKYLKSEGLIKFIILSMMAGIYVGFGVILVYSIGAPLREANEPVFKAVMGASFGIALTLVIFAGSELFTGNNMIMVFGNLEGRVTIKSTIIIWLYSYIGNFIGSALLAYGFAISGLAAKLPVSDFILNVSTTKMNLGFTELFVRGILCNMLVCLAIWSQMKAKEEAAKLILIFWCLFAFVGSGFEHSIANMTLLSTALFIPHSDSVNVLGLVKNLLPVSLGNMVGGAIFIGCGYWFVSTKKVENR